MVDAALGGWGSAPEAFDPAVRAAYVAALSDPGHVHAICEEYRAAAGDRIRLIGRQGVRDSARNVRAAANERSSASRS